MLAHASHSVSRPSGPLGARADRSPRRWTASLLLLSVPFALSLVGCGHPTQRALQGRWLGDSVENFDDEVSAAAMGWAKGTSFEFAGSTLTVAIPAEEPRTGTYRVEALEERTVRLAVLDPAGETSELVLLLDDEASLRWVLGGGRSIVMRRQ